MSTKSMVLISVIVLAILAVAFFGLYYPPPADEAAQGAIGGVEKHRAEQISDEDVLLGDEEARQHEQILYGDYLTDAEALSNFQSSYSNIAKVANQQKALEGRALESFRSDLNALTRSVANRLSELGQRSAGSFQVFNKAFENQLGRGVIVTLGDASQQKLENLRAAMGNLEKELEGMSRLDNKAFEKALGAFDSYRSDFQNLATLEARSLESFAKSMEQFRKDLESRAAGLSNNELANWTARLENQARELEDRSMGLQVIANAPKYFENMALQHRALNSFHQQLSGLQNQIANRERVEQKFLSNQFSRLNSFEKELGSRVRDFGNAAVLNMQNRMQNRSLEQRHLESLSTIMQATSRAVDNRAASFENRPLQSFESALQNARKAVEQRTREMEMRFLGAMQLELNAIGNALDNRAAIFNQQTLESAQRYLNSVTRQLDSRLQLQNRELQSTANLLESKAAQLENRLGLLQNRGGVQ